MQGMDDRSPSLDDLVLNGTVSPEMAATLASTAAERHSFLTVAIPRLAGKTTVMRAMLAHAPEGTALAQLTRLLPDLGIPDAPAEGQGGYLMMSEIAPVGFAEYLWGEPVRQVFASLDRGFSLATALHAGGVDEAFEVICRGNGVPDEQAAHLRLAVYIRVLGQDWRQPEGRRVAAVHEIVSVEAGQPRTRLLHRWDETTDTFEAVEQPRRIAADGAAFEQRLARFQVLRPR
ncbi:MAG: hypothetical protein WD734_03945 [Dehalococcoidia bacterium]